MFHLIKANLIISLMLLAVSCKYDGESPYTIYETAADAKLDGAIRRGWLPDWLPEDAIQIHEHHDLDTNSRAFSFNLSSSGGFSWPAICRPVEQAQRPVRQTKLFPSGPIERNNVQSCGDLYVSVDEQGLVHAWSN